MQAPWLLLVETDYVWMKPLQAPPAQVPSSRGMAYPFNYIVPQAPALESVMRKMFPSELGPLSAIPPSVVGSCGRSHASRGRGLRGRGCL